jgi:Rrf2 family protein
MLSNASKYAIRATLYLAENSSESNKFGAKIIASDLEIPLSFMAKILQNLAKSQVISSTKGPGGGFYTSEKDLKNNVLAILNTIENEDVFEGCFLGLPRCSDENPCPVHHIVGPFKEAIYDKFSNQNIGDFAKEIKENGSFLSLKGIHMDLNNNQSNISD